ncbi:MAG TPA: hypothetical protein VKO18_02640 [Terriglobia bacterium]|nr:hypothetical protein [Terriglobia bacterium]
MEWTEVAKTVGSASVILIVVAYFLRGVFGQVLSRDLEKFKAELSAKHDIEIERLRNDLRIAASEHETRFTRLHETRAEVIAELYKRLVYAHEAFDAYLSKVRFAGEPDDAQRIGEAARYAHELAGYFLEKRIYFDEELCGDIDVAIQKLVNIFVWTVNYPQEMPGSLEKWSQAALHFGERFPAIRAKIERQFRELIGVHITQSNGERTTDKQA